MSFLVLLRNVSLFNYNYNSASWNYSATVGTAAVGQCQHASLITLVTRLEIHQCLNNYNIS